MSLDDTISQIRDKLQKGLFPNEATVSNGAVLPILHALEWPVFDTSIVSPQYTVEGRRVDYALCRSNGQPVVFLEVKRVGAAGSGERQLFEYAFHHGVPLAVLTDGQEWNFYLPAGEGTYEERRVYKLDLLERDLAECSHRLNRYLSHTDVASGVAFENAQSDYKDANREREIERILPQAWDTLLSEADDVLVEFLADKVENLCGYKPDSDTCAVFLSSIARNAGPTVTSRQAPTSPVPPVSPQVANSRQSQLPSPTRNTGQTGFVLQSEQYPCRNGTEVLVEVFEELTGNDSTFPERFAARKHGRSRRYLAQDKYDLYPDQPDLCDNASRQLKCGWFIGTNWNNSTKQKIIRLACEVAGLEFGRDLIINFD